MKHLITEFFDVKAISLWYKIEKAGFDRISNFFVKKTTEIHTESIMYLHELWEKYLFFKIKSKF